MSLSILAYAGQCQKVSNPKTLLLFVCAGSGRTSRSRCPPTGQKRMQGDGILLEGHATLVVNVTGLAQVTFIGSHRIRRNGTVGADRDFLSGLRVSRASATISGGTQITNNVGPGILSDFNSSVQIGPDATIAGNAGGGVRLVHMSVGNFVAPFRPSQSVTCDDTSLVFDDVAGHGFHCNHSDGASSSVGSASGLKR